MATWLIYGANGYTGSLIAREAARRGLEPILAGRNAEAVAAFGRAIARGDRDPGTWYSRGVCRLRLGDRTGAVEDFHATLRLDPSNAAAQAELQALGG